MLGRLKKIFELASIWKFPKLLCESIGILLQAGRECMQHMNNFYFWSLTQLHPRASWTNHCCDYLVIHFVIVQYDYNLEFFFYIWWDNFTLFLVLNFGTMFVMTNSCAHYFWMCVCINSWCKFSLCLSCIWSSPCSQGILYLQDYYACSNVNKKLI